MSATDLLTLGDELLARLRSVPFDPAELQPLLDRREQMIAQLPPVPPGLATLLAQQDDRIQSALATLMRALRRQLRYCQPTAGPGLVDACR